jgi:trehalose 6-phosphate synthase
VDRFLERNPGCRERFTFVQVGVPSRTHISRYKALSDQIELACEEINWKWSADSWRPVVFLKEHLGTIDMEEAAVADDEPVQSVSAASL